MQLTVTNKFSRSLPGVLVFDRDDHLVYANKEAYLICRGQESALEDRQIEETLIYMTVWDLLNRFKKGIVDQNSVDRNSAAEERNNLANIKTEDAVLILQVVPLYEPMDEGNPALFMVLVGKSVEKREVDLQAAGQEFSLSKREMDVLRLIMRGYMNHEIADSLFICEYTVKDHIKKIMRKLGCRSRGELIATLK